MANEAEGEFDVELGGVHRTIKYRMRTLAELQTETGMPIQRLFELGRTGQYGVKEALSLISCGLRGGGDRKMDAGILADMLDAEPDKLWELVTVATRAISWAMGGRAKKKGDDDSGETKAKTETSPSTSTDSRP